MPAPFAVTLFFNGTVPGNIVWIGISVLTAGIVLFIILRQAWFMLVKKKNYVLVGGTVVLVEHIPDHSIYDKHSDFRMPGRDVYRFGISFTTLEGQTYDLVCKNYSMGFEHVKYGDIVNVYYAPADPKKFYAELKKPRLPKLRVYRTGIFR